MVHASQPETDSNTRPFTDMELFVREKHPGDHDFTIAYRMGPHASAGVAEVYGSNIGITPDVARALAHLMAASPKLLKALKAILDCHIRSITAESWERGRAVVAEAEGRPYDTPLVEWEARDMDKRSQEAAEMRAEMIPADDAAEAAASQERWR